MANTIPVAIIEPTNNLSPKYMILSFDLRMGKTNARIASIIPNPAKLNVIICRTSKILCNIFLIIE